MIRKTLLAISLVLLVGTVGLWVRSYWISDWLVIPCGGTRYLGATSVLGVVTVGVYDATFNDWRPDRISVLSHDASAHKEAVAVMRSLFDFDAHRPFDFFSGWVVVGGQPVRSTSMNFPHCVVVGALAIPSLLKLGSRLRRHHRRRHNLCVTCGYNLKGNVSGRCSECGAAIEFADGTHDEEGGAEVRQ